MSDKSKHKIDASVVICAILCVVLLALCVVGVIFGLRDGVPVVAFADSSDELPSSITYPRYRDNLLVDYGYALDNGSSAPFYDNYTNILARLNTNNVYDTGLDNYNQVPLPCGNMFNSFFLYYSDSSFVGQYVETVAADGVCSLRTHLVSDYPHIVGFRSAPQTVFPKVLQFSIRMSDYSVKDDKFVFVVNDTLNIDNASLIECDISDNYDTENDCYVFLLDFSGFARDITYFGFYFDEVSFTVPAFITYDAIKLESGYNNLFNPLRLFTGWFPSQFAYSYGLANANGGYDDGYNAGYDAGLHSSDAYNQGYNDGSVSQEYIDNLVASSGVKFNLQAQYGFATDSKQILDYNPDGTQFVMLTVQSSRIEDYTLTNSNVASQYSYLDLDLPYAIFYNTRSIAGWYFVRHSISTSGSANNFLVANVPFSLTLNSGKLVAYNSSTDSYIPSGRC